MKKFLILLLLMLSTNAWGDASFVPEMLIKDEGTNQGFAQTIDFTGSGVSASVSSGAATVNISGGGGGAGGSGIEIQVDDVGIGTTFTVIDWNSSYFAVTENPANEEANITLQSALLGWTDGGTNVYTSTTTDNVGIGTTTPGNKLDVRGGLYVSGNVGIGTTGPTTQLQLTGTGTFNTSVSTPTLTLSGTGTINGLDAIDATGEATLESTLDIAGDVDGTGLSSVDLDELAVEAELEAVLDLQDMQGAVTDAQVPNTITIDLAAAATALAANGTNCSAGNYPLGVDASGNAESCTAVGGGSPGGSSSQIQYNNAGSFGGASGFVWDGTNVGIGTAGPTQKLQVVGTALIDTLTLTNDLAVAQGGTGASSLNDLITLGTHSTGNYVATIAGTTDEVTVTGSGSENAAVTLSLPTAVKGWTDGGTNVYTSTTTDNVGIGTTTPTTNFKLDVRGATYISGNVGIGTTTPVAGLAVMNGNVGIGTWSPTGRLEVRASVVIPPKHTADPCSAGVEGGLFYNDTSNYWCGCDGTNDVKLTDNTTACF